MNKRNVAVDALEGPDEDTGFLNGRRIGMATGNMIKIPVTLQMHLVYCYKS